MSPATRILRAVGPDPIELDEVTSALAVRFVVEPGPARRVRVVRLDTFDHRLRAAGISLEHVVSAGEGVVGAGQNEVRVRRGATTAVAAIDRGQVWPAFAAALPEGAVRELVAPVTGIRALLVGAHERHLLRRLDLTNADAKIVARVEVDELVVGSPAATSVAGATVLALRGYDGPARLAGELLVGVGFELVAAEGVRVPVSSAAAPELRSRAEPADVLLAAAFAGFAAVLRANLPGLVDDVDTEFLHDFRVALRRTRSTLRLGRPVLPGHLRTRWEPEFKRLGAATTRQRDLDVYELGLPAMSAWLVAAHPADLGAFATHLHRRREVERVPLVRLLRSARFSRLLADWDDDLDVLAVEARSGAGPVRTSAGELADRTIARATRRVLRRGAAISAASPATDLHKLRAGCKELRYALEVFAPVFDPGTRIVRELKGLQDVLGRYQDSEVQQHALRQFADEMMEAGAPASSLLAMGELIGHLEAEQGRARQEFHTAFQQFEQAEHRRGAHRSRSSS